MKITRNILFGLFCSSLATQVFCSGLDGTAKECNAEADGQFAGLSKALTAKDIHFPSMIYESYKKWRLCDDGAVYEGYSELIPRAFSQYAESILGVLNLMRQDPKFTDFVLKHLDTTFADVNALKAVEKNVRANCHDKDVLICKNISAQCALQIGGAVASISNASVSPARSFDFESYLAKPYVGECSAPSGRKLVYVDTVTYHDFGGDGQEEAIVVAASCMTGTAGPDIHDVYWVRSATDATKIPIEEVKVFEGQSVYDHLVGNRNWRLYAEHGFLVQDFYDGSGRDHPLKVFFKLDSHRFKVAKVTQSPTYAASFDCSKAKLENEIIICGNADIAQADMTLDKPTVMLLRVLLRLRRMSLGINKPLGLKIGIRSAYPIRELAALIVCGTNTGTVSKN